MTPFNDMPFNFLYIHKFLLFIAQVFWEFLSSINIKFDESIDFFSSHSFEDPE